MIPSYRLSEAAGAPTPASNDRRNSGRLVCQDIVTSLGRVIDISAGGFRVAARRKPWVAVGAAYECTVHSPLGSFTVPTRVMRVERKGIGRYDIGLAIEDASPVVRETLNLIARSLCRPYSPYR